MHCGSYNYPISLNLKLVLSSTNHCHRNTCEGFMLECHKLLTMALFGVDGSASSSLFLSWVVNGLAPKLTKKEINKLPSNTTCYKISIQLHVSTFRGYHQKRFRILQSNNESALLEKGSKFQHSSYQGRLESEDPLRTTLVQVIHYMFHTWP